MARRRGLLPGALLIFAGALLHGLAPGGARGAAPGEDGPPGAEAIAERLQRKYERAGSLVADFEQENTLISLGRTTRSKGRFSLHKPGRIRFEYREPERQILVSDGKRLWIYTPRLRQVILADLERAAASPTPLLFLAGKGNLSESFRIKVEEPGVGRRKGGAWRRGQPHRLSLTPRRPDPRFQRLWLEVDPESFLILGVEFTDALGNRTRLRFTNIREGVEIPPERFTFKVPEDAEVVRVPASPGGGR
ncbi:MAG: outer membrane lipoprotein carrier protein LolA [bacterium]